MILLPMLNLYRAPLGLPLRWQDEQSGRLPEAVKAFFGYRASEEQLKLVIAYCQYYIKAPCWASNAFEDEAKSALAQLRESAEALKDADGILDWIYECLKIGIDPL